MKKSQEFKVTAPCQSCRQRFAYVRVVGDERQPLCPHCDFEQVPKTDVTGFSAMSFNRCGSGDTPSKWEEIMWRPR